MTHMFHTLKVLLWTSWRRVVNEFWRGGLKTKFWMITAVLVAVAVGIADFAFSTLTIGAMRAADNLRLQDAGSDIPAMAVDPSQLLAVLPSAVLFGIMMLVLFTSIGSALSGLFFSKHLERLLLAPISVGAVFMATLLSTVVGYWFLMIYAAVIPMMAYGIVLNASWGYFLAVPPLVLSLPLLPTALGAVIATGLVRILPANRMRELITIASSLIGIGCYVLFQVLPQTLRNSSIDTVSIAQRFDYLWLPSAWGGRGLRLLAEGNSSGWFWIWMLIGLSVGALFASALLTQRLYLTGWQSIAGSNESRSKRVIAANWEGWGGPFSSVIKKDIRTLLRDLRQLSQFLWIFIVFGVWIWQTSTGMRSSRNINAAAFQSNTLAIMTLFMCSSVSNNLALTGISREGNTFWLLQLAPLPTSRLILSKWLLAWMVYPILGLIMVGVGIGFGFLTVQFGLIVWVITSLVGIGVTMLEIAIGAISPVLNWDKPQQMVRPRIGCLSTLLGWITLAVLAALYAIAFLPTFATFPWLVRLLCGLGGGILTALVFWLGLGIAADRLAKLEQ